MRSVLLLAAFVLAAPVVHSAAPAAAGEYNEVLKIGDAAPVWTKLPGTDGADHALADFKQQAVVVVFTCNSCPVATDYEDRIIAFAKKHAEQVGVVAINVNRIPDDSLAKMKARAEKKQLPYPYLFDETQQIAKDYGAIFTPEFFVLNASRKVAYMGGFDDNSNLAEVKHNYLEPAIAAVLSGKAPATAETLARGCRIRFARPAR
ncbi:MAG TPA: thioredoxin family protein [Pirellulales bacterium]|jgi:peroxiredoxin|nr:thioredoxin family protein [Pirellulales bacterium]